MKVVLFILFFGFFLVKIKDPVLFYFIYKKKEMLFVQWKLVFGYLNWVDSAEFWISLMNLI